MPDHQIDELEKLIARAHEIFSRDHNCAQAVLLAAGEPLAIVHDQALMMSAAFGGGIARTGQICGALTGALMALGLHAKTTRMSEITKKDVYEKSRKVIAEFERIMGSQDCRILTQANLCSEEDRKKAAERGVFQTICPKAIEAACRALALHLDE